MSVDRFIRAVIFDVDGTLVDSNDAHARAWYEALESMAYHANYDVVRSWIGMGGDKLIPRAIGEPESSAAGKKLAERRAEIFRSKFLPELRPFPKSRDLVKRLKEEGLQLMVASSAPSVELGELLKIADVDDLLVKRVAGDEAEASKPSPDVICASLEKIDIPPRKVRMIGDTPYDVEAAAIAGVRTWAFRCGGWKDNHLIGAVRVFEGPADLLMVVEKEGLSRLP